MKTFRLPTLTLLLLLLTWTGSTVLSSRAVAADMVPFHATFTEQISLILPGVCGPTTCVSAQGIGQASHLGRTTEQHFIVTTVTTFPPPPYWDDTHKVVLTAANGDQLFLSGASREHLISATQAASTGTYQVTGGTGRFNGARGGGKLSFTVTLTGPASGTSVITYDGMVSTTGSAH